MPYLDWATGMLFSVKWYWPICLWNFAKTLKLSSICPAEEVRVLLLVLLVLLWDMQQVSCQKSKKWILTCTERAVATYIIYLQTLKLRTQLAGVFFSLFTQTQLLPSICDFCEIISGNTKYSDLYFLIDGYKLHYSIIFNLKNLFNL